MTRYAHTLPDTVPEVWELVETHLSEVAELATQFARALRLPDDGAAPWASALGRWHDIGKYSDDFQAMLYHSNGIEAHLEGQPGRVDHSTAGAQHAAETVPRVGRLLAYAIAGHHGGLADAAALDGRLSKEIPPWQNHADAALLSAPSLGMPPLTLNPDGKTLAFQLAFFTRMVFSCLIDADRLATERFCDGEKSAQRNPPPPIPEFSRRLDQYLENLARESQPTPVNARRQEVLAACRAAADMPTGLFSLTVPTGGGKTLAALAFALRHAERHGLRRVITAIPFTSITEQTANQYREVFADLGAEAVLEHHSNLDPEKETYRNRLATENWDASLVVTTNVQLLESLFANRTKSCRKLHRIAGSVIVLDEAQTLPVDLLRPALAALRELVVNYRCTVVLCTATQPALELRDEFSIGLEDVREIIPHPETLSAAMRRVEATMLGEIDDDELIERLSEEPSWLTIVNTKGHAAAIYRRLAGETPPEDLFHLSTLMCGQHRSDQVIQIKQRLAEGLPCRVVSTQLIEAGVDVDFPVVFRAMAGVDSIAQAAGRCNREGRLPGLGRLWLFDPIDVQPKGYLGATAATTRELLPDFPDPLDPAAVQRYFELHYWKRSGDNQWDDPGVMECFPPGSGLRYDFETAAQLFRPIDDRSETVFVPYGDGRKLIEQLRRGEPDRSLLRRLQRYTVGLTPWVCQTLVTAGDVEELGTGFLVLANADLYCENVGIRIDRPGWRDAESNVV